MHLLLSMHREVCSMNLVPYHVSWRHCIVYFPSLFSLCANPSGHAVFGVGLRSLACWDCGLESRRGHGCVSVVNFLSCRIEVSTTGRSLVQRIPAEDVVSECDRETSCRRSGPARAIVTWEQKLFCLPAIDVVTVTERDSMLSNAFVTSELDRLCNEAAVA